MGDARWRKLTHSSTSPALSSLPASPAPARPPSLSSSRPGVASCILTSTLGPGGGAYLEETRWPTPEEGEQWKATRAPELASAVDKLWALCEAAKPGVPFPRDAVDDLL